MISIPPLMLLLLDWLVLSPMLTRSGDDLHFGDDDADHDVLVGRESRSAPASEFHEKDAEQLEDYGVVEPVQTAEEAFQWTVESIP